MTVQPPEPRPIRLLVNVYSSVVHKPSCVYARGCVPWSGFAKARSDKACRVCRPNLTEREAE